MDAIAWLYGLQLVGVKLGLASTRQLLELTGHPERAYPSLLVGGTNGKGSVAAMIHAILSAAGLRSGLYTSPHLVRPTERIRIGHDEIGRAELGLRLTRLRELIEAERERGTMPAYPSFFEVLTVAALEAFREHAVEAAVLEVGLGGRLDATNTVDAEVAVIVSVARDHERVLGTTLAAIAGEKAGIIKQGKPLVSGVTAQEAITVLLDTCREREAPFVDARAAARLVAEHDGRFTLETAHARYTDLSLPLPGRHQLDNARIAVAAAEAFAATLGVGLAPEAVARGLATVRWPGRLQWIRPREGPPILLDGAHNLEGTAALCRYLERLAGPRPVAIFGVMQDKPARAMLEQLGPHLDGLVLTQPAVGRAVPPDQLLGLADATRLAVEVEPRPERALARARELAGDAHPILVTGSLYLIGEVLAVVEGGSPAEPVAL